MGMCRSFIAGLVGFAAGSIGIARGGRLRSRRLPRI